MKLRNDCQQSELHWRKTEEMLYLTPKNGVSSLFLWTANWKWLFWSNLFPLYYVVIYLVNWRKAASKSHFSFAVQEKRLKKPFFGAKYSIFLFVSYSKLVGIPCKCNRQCLLLQHWKLAGSKLSNIIRPTWEKALEPLQVTPVLGRLALL